MPKKLTERQAWLKLAAAWKKAMPSDTGSYAIRSGLGFRSIVGLCGSINDLHYENLVGYETVRSMRGKISQERDRLNVGAFLWPLTKEGQRKRVAFCLRMARKPQRGRTP